MLVSRPLRTFFWNKFGGILGISASPPRHFTTANLKPTAPPSPGADRSRRSKDSPARASREYLGKIDQSKTPIQMLARYKHQKDAAGTLNLMQLATRDPNFDIRALNKFLRTIVKLERYKDVRQVRKVMRKLDLQPTPLTFGLLARAYGAIGHVPQLDALWEDFVRFLSLPASASLLERSDPGSKKHKKSGPEKPMNDDSSNDEDLVGESRAMVVNSFAAFVDAYGRCRSLEGFENVLAFLTSKKVKPTVVFWERLMEAYANAGRMDKVEEVFSKIKSLPNVPKSALIIPYTTALRISVRAGKLAAISALEQEVKELKIPLDAGWCNALIHAYSRFPITEGTDASSQNDQRKSATDLFAKIGLIVAEMKTQNVPQDRHSRDALLAACGRLGCIERAPELITWRCPAHRISPTVTIPSVDICFEDEHLIVLNKPPLLSTTPLFPLNNERPCLLDVAWAHCDGRLSRLSTAPGLIHRLDRDTSGAVVFAKTDVAYVKLQHQFESRQVRKEYLAFVHKIPNPTVGVIDRPIARVERRRGPGVSCSVNDSLGQPVGKESITQWRVLKEFNEDHALVVCIPVTGRTHQIRVHMAYLGHPIVGDRLYGFGPTKNGSLPVPRIMLHCYCLTFKHPVTGEAMEIRAPLPRDFKNVNAVLNGETTDEDQDGG